MSTRSVLITGASGQDGWYLIGCLQKAGYEVHAQTRALPSDADQPADVRWHVGDLTKDGFLEDLVDAVQPSQIYNLAAISRPTLSWAIPIETAGLNALVPHRICEIIRLKYPATRLFQASSSEMFARGHGGPQDEATPVAPRNPYGVAKAYAHNIVGAYRAQFKLHLSTGILFNHESPRRPLGFVSQKIAHAAAGISLGLTDTEETDDQGYPILKDGKVRLGRIDARRDFGYAGDVAEAMVAIVEHDVADDYVIGTGESHSIADFCEAAFRFVGRDWRDHVIHEAGLVRPDDVDTLANPAKLSKLLGHGLKTSFADLVAQMVQARIDLIAGGLVRR
jgi:GDPmannose 4,6-dehydratase